MSLICLSSRGVNVQPENFSNFFGGRGIEFPKNSEICLVGGSVKKHAPGKAMVSLTPENNTFVCHYGAPDTATPLVPVDGENLLRDDVFTIPPQTSASANVASSLAQVWIDQCTVSPIRKAPTSTIGGAAGWTLTQDMWENRATKSGLWSPPTGLPFTNYVGVANGPPSTRLTPPVPPPNYTHFMEDSRRLWNTDNQGRSNSYAGNLEGLQYRIQYGGGVTTVEEFSGLQGGIVTGNRLGDIHKADSWVNFPVESEADAPMEGAYEQKIDLGWSIEGAVLRVYKNAYKAGIASGYEREYLHDVALPAIGAVTQIDIHFRPIYNNPAAPPAPAFCWEVFYKIGGGAYTQASLVTCTPPEGTFPFGHFNGNGAVNPVGIGLNAVMSWGNPNSTRIEVFGCYDDMPGTILGAGVTFDKTLTYGTSYISDIYASANGIWSPFKQLCQSRATIADPLGFFSGQIVEVADTTVGFSSDSPTSAWNYSDSPLVVQLPNLPITGYLGGGSSVIGGATALPILGIIDGFQIDENPSVSISSPYNENWIKLLNKDSFTVNELQVRITDMYGVTPDYLDNPSHVWVKIRSRDGFEKI